VSGVTLTEVVVALALAVGLAGILVPLLPGSALIFAGVLVWALSVGTSGAWTVLALVTVVLLVGTVVKYAVPGKRLKGAGIPTSTQWIGAGLAIVGFFVVPVIGIVIGFVLGVYLAEHRRLGPTQAWPSTKHALRAVGLSILIELTAGIVATLTWIVGVVVT